jgi:hypothetical protein
MIQNATLFIIREYIHLNHIGLITSFEQICQLIKHEYNPIFVQQINVNLHSEKNAKE